MNYRQRRYQELMEIKRVNAPLCACGCGQKTNWLIRTRDYGRYLFNHQLPDKTSGWSDHIEQIVRGTVIGDGYLDPRRGRKKIDTGRARLMIRHSTKRQLPYIQWLYQQLLPIITSPIRIRKTEKSFGAEIAELGTVSLPQLYKIRQETYDMYGRKMVTRQYLDTLTDLSVAIWWCDDGSHSSLSTHSFTLNENELIADWFNKRYGTEMRVVWDRRVNLPYIRCNRPTMRAISSAIFPYVEKSLWYKFGTLLPELLRQQSAASNQSVAPQPTTLV